MNGVTNDVVSAIYGRRAVRAFTAEPVSRDDVDRLIQAAIQAPSSMDLQPWAFIVVEGVAKLRGYSERAKPHFAAPPNANAEHLRSTLDDPSVNIFHDAPLLIVLCATDVHAQSVEDCSLAAQNLMLAAHAFGLATCPIGFSRPWLRLPDTKAELGIAPHHVPAFPLVVGHAAEVPRGPGRKAPVVVRVR
jgi:nitroreductase